MRRGDYPEVQNQVRRLRMRLWIRVRDGVRGSRVRQIRLSRNDLQRRLRTRLRQASSFHRCQIQATVQDDLQMRS